MCGKRNGQTNPPRAQAQGRDSETSKRPDDACLPRLLASADLGVYHVRRVGKFECRYLKEVVR